MIKRILLIGTLFLITNQLFAVNSSRKIDSLQRIIKQTNNDTTKCETYQTLGYLYLAIDLDSAKFCNDKALYYAKKINHPKKIGDAYLYFTFYYKAIQDKKKAISSIEKAIDIYDAVDSLTELSMAYSNLGSFHIMFEDYWESLKAFKKGIEVASQQNDYDKIATLHSNCGLNYEYLGRYASAATEYIKAIELREKYELPHLNAAYINLAGTFFDQKNYDKALNYYYKGVAHSDFKYDQRFIATAYNGIAESYIHQNEYDSAYFYYQKGYTLEGGLTQFEFEQCMGKLKLAQNLPEQALNHLTKALSLTDTTVTSMVHCDFYCLMAQAQLAVSQTNNDDKTLLRKAFRNGEKSENMAKALRLNPKLSKAYKVLSEITMKANNIEESLAFTHKWIALNDSLDNIEQTNYIADLEAKYESDKKQLEIELLNQENKIKDTDLQKSIQTARSQRIIISLIVAGLLLTLIFIALLYRQSNKRKVINAELANKNKTIAEQKIQVEKALSELTVKDDEKELLLKEIHHRVKNNLQVISSLLELQAKKVSDTESEVFKEGQSRVKAMALIHEELYQNNDLGKVDFKAYTAKLSRQIQSLFPTKNGVSIRIEGEALQLDIDTAIPLGLIINELITNAFKYGLSENGTLWISFYKNNDGSYGLNVKDNGQGIPNSFDLKKSKSLGLRLVNRLSKQLYGQANYYHENGASFVIDFKDTIQRKAVA